MQNDKVKILLVDDEPDILEFVGYNLRKEGFLVYTAKNGQMALDLAIKEVPDLILLDVMMPELDGMETCEMIRSTPGLDNIIIAFLTARGEDYSQIAGFEAGADDYITKPIKPKVLISRVKALLRRKFQKSSDSHDSEVKSIIVGDLEIDRSRYIVIAKGKELSLPRKEFELLYLLASKPDRVFTREEIYQAIWGNDIIVGDRTMDVHIRKLREKIGESLIKTIKGVGYKFVSTP